MFKFDFEKERFLNPCMQQNTSMTSIFANQLDVPSGTPVFSDSEVVHVFHDFDMLLNDYDPVSISLNREIQQLSEKMSSVNSSSNTENV